MEEGKIPEFKKSGLPASSRALYEEWLLINKRLQEEKMTAEERAVIEKTRRDKFKEYETACDREKYEPESVGQEFLEALKDAIKQKDKTVLRKTILRIQEFVNRANPNTDMDFIRFEDEELDKLLNKDGATILVGTGTHGQRIFIWRDGLGMSGDRHGQEYRDRFARLFSLKFDPNEDLKVEF